MGKKSTSVENIFKCRPTIKQYARLEDESKAMIDLIIKHGIKPNKELRIKKKKLKPVQENFWFLSWIELINLRGAVEEMKIFEALEMVYNISNKQITKLDVFNCFAAYLWICEELKEIGRVEVDRLGSEPTAEEKNAGVDLLTEFDYNVSLDVLAKGDILKYDEILKKPYAVIFRKLCLDKVKNQIQQNFITNANRKT